jgi:hypothetical protein
MGADCCNMKTNQEENDNEIKKDLKISDFETKVTRIEESEKSYLFKNSFRSANEQLFFEIKESPYEDYSKSIFSRLNEIRSHPLYFYSYAKKNNLSELIEKLIKNQLTNYKLNWSSLKSKVIYKIMHNENMKINEKINNLELCFNRENKTFIYYSIGEIENIDICIWNLLKYFPEDNYKILTQDYTNCSIYTENLIEEHFIYLNKLKDFNINNYNHNNELLITFFFFFQKLHSL